jgi:hypothetical protein
VDPLAHQVHRLLQSESHTLPDWLQYLAASARERVGTRLVDAGVVRRVQRRGLLRPVVRYPALDPDRAAWRAGRLRALLLHGLQAGGRDRGVAAVGAERCADWMVIALAAATELAPHVLLWSRDVPLTRLAWVVERLPPPLRSLARHTQRAVAQVAFTGI